MDAVANLKAITGRPSPFFAGTVAAVTGMTVTLRVGEAELDDLTCLDSYWPRAAGDTVWAVAISASSVLVLGSITGNPATDGPV